MSYLWFSLFSILCFTILSVLQRVLAVESKNPRATAVIFNIAAAIIALTIFIVNGNYKNLILPSSKIAWISLGLAVLFYGMFERGRFYAAKLLEASVLTTIINISLLITLAGSVILYSETITFDKLLGGLLILSALFIVSHAKSNKQISIYGIVIGVLVSVAIGLAQVLDKRGAIFFSPEIYSIFVWVLPILIIVFPSIKIADIKYELKRSSWRLIFIALANVLGYLFMLKALAMAEVTRVMPLIQTSTLLTVLSGILILNERDNIARKIIAGGIALAGVYFLV